MKYCPRCGHEVSKINKTQYHCNGCGVDNYTNPKAATAVYLFDEDDNICFGLRAHDPHKGGLDCPGGFVDWGEGAEDALMRELNEEIGLMRDDIYDLQYVASTFDLYDWHGVDEPVTSNYYYARLKPGTELTPGDDIAEIVRIPFAEIDPTKFAWEGMRSSYPSLLKFLQVPDRYTL